MTFELYFSSRWGIWTKAILNWQIWRFFEKKWLLVIRNGREEEEGGGGEGEEGVNGKSQSGGNHILFAALEEL